MAKHAVVRFDRFVAKHGRDPEGEGDWTFTVETPEGERLGTYRFGGDFTYVIAHVESEAQNDHEEERVYLWVEGLPDVT